MKKLFSIIISFLVTLNLFAEVSITCSKKWEQHQVCDKGYFTLCYIEDLEIPEYVYYDLLKDHAIDDSTPRKDSFKSDPEITTGSAVTADYTNSGYDRGHLANCDDFRYDETAMKTTFLMSNIAPQLPAFNRGGAWRSSEVQGEAYAVCYGHVEIITGPIFTNTVMTYIGKKNKIAVPDGFYKIFYNKENNILEAFVIYQNDCSKNLDSYKVSIETVETLTGLKFEFK